MRTTLRPSEENDKLTRSADLRNALPSSCLCVFNLASLSAERSNRTALWSPSAGIHRMCTGGFAPSSAGATTSEWQPDGFQRRCLADGFIQRTIRRSFICASARIPGGQQHAGHSQQAKVYHGPQAGLCKMFGRLIWTCWALAVAGWTSVGVG